jgi:hypothetical protein
MLEHPSAVGRPGNSVIPAECLSLRPSRAFGREIVQGNPVCLLIMQSMPDKNRGTAVKQPRLRLTEETHHAVEILA